MSMIETKSDIQNKLLLRREITCTFRGLGGKLKTLEAVDMVSKQFKLDGKVVVPIRLKNETGRPMISGTFYIYDDEKLARAHVKPAIFKRLEKAKGGGEKAEGETKEAAPAETKAAPEKKDEKKEDPVEKKEAKAEKKEDKKEAPVEKKKEDTK